MTTRRHFLGQLGAVGASMGALLLVGCGDDDGNGGTDAGGGSDGGGGTCSPSPTIGSNHGHSINVTSADVTAGADKSYDIQGTSGHAHSVTVTAAMFADIAAGTSVVATSTNDNGHTHPVSIICN